MLKRELFFQGLCSEIESFQPTRLMFLHVSSMSSCSDSHSMEGFSLQWFRSKHFSLQGFPKTLFWLRFVVYRSQIQFRFLNWKFNILIFNSDFWIENSTFQFSNLAFSIQKYELKIEMLNFQFRNLNWTCNCWIFHLQIQIKFSVNCVSDLENFPSLYISSQVGWQSCHQCTLI